jgi:hypothetical protein
MIDWIHGVTLVSPLVFTCDFSLAFFELLCSYGSSLLRAERDATDLSVRYV